MFAFVLLKIKCNAVAFGEHKKIKKTKKDRL